MLFSVLVIHGSVHSIRQVERAFDTGPKNMPHYSIVESHMPTQAWEGHQRSYPHPCADEGPLYSRPFAYARKHMVYCLFCTLLVKGVTKCY